MKYYLNHQKVEKSYHCPIVPPYYFEECWILRWQTDDWMNDKKISFGWSVIKSVATNTQLTYGIIPLTSSMSCNIVRQGTNYRSQLKKAWLGNSLKPQNCMYLNLTLSTWQMIMKKTPNLSNNWPLFHVKLSRNLL